MRTVLLATSLTTVVAVSACSGDSDRPAVPAAPTTAAVATSAPSTSSPTTTTVVPTTAAAAGATTAPTAPSPESYAKALYDAWAQGDRAAAERVAAPEAVAALFARQWQAADGWAFVECSGATGSVICTWQRPSGRLLFRVQTGDAPVTVSDVRFQP